MSNTSSLRYVILFVGLYFSFLFFPIYSLLGLKYEGADNDGTFVYGYMFLDLLVLIYFVKGIIKRNPKAKEIFWLFLCVVVLISFLIEAPQSGDGNNDGRLFLAETIPGIMIAIILARKGEVYNFTKYFDILCLVITCAIAMNFRLFLMGSFGLGGTENYQALAYNSALAFYLNFFTLLADDHYFPRFKVFKNKLYRLIQLILLPVQVLACIMSGGRGGAVVIIVSVFFILFYTNKWNKTKYNTGLIMFLVIISITIAGIAIPKEYMDPIMSGFERQFSYLSSSGIDMGATSNRDIMYVEAFKAFNENPIFGYGLFTYADRLDSYPHNIFLQILVQGGLILFIPMIIFFIFVLFKMKILLRKPENASLLLMAINPFLLLLFSSSYLREPVFWCVCVYVSLLSTKVSRREIRGDMMHKEIIFKLNCQNS